VEVARRAGVPIHTIGLDAGRRHGRAAPVDRAFLAEVARRTGGTYCDAADAHQLASVYSGVRHRTSGDVVFSASGRIRQGETVNAGQLMVPAWQSELHGTLGWPGSKLDLVLIDPAGCRVDKTYRGASWESRKGMSYCIIRNPMGGMWKARIYGKQVPPDGCNWSLVCSTREPSPPDDSRWAALGTGLLLILLTGCFISFGVSGRRTSTTVAD
jgi:hypothetical protein